MQLQAIARQFPVNQPDDPCFVKTRAQNGAKSAKTPDMEESPRQNMSAFNVSRLF